MKKTKFIPLVGLSVLALTAIALPHRRAKSGPEMIHLNGRLEAVSVDLGPKVTGRVLEMRVREGDRVKAGDLLLRLDLGDAAIAVARDQAGARSAAARFDDLQEGSRRAEIAAADAEVTDRKAAERLATIERDRQLALFRQDVGTQRDFDQAQTELDRAQAALKVSQEKLKLARDGFRNKETLAAKAESERAAAVLQQSLTNAREAEVRAPADGVILHRLAEPGQLIAAGQPAVTMAFADRLYVRTFIPEAQLGKVKMGAAARVLVDAHGNTEFRARISEISPDAEFTPKPVETKNERVNLVYAAKADLDRGWKEPLVPGQPADVIVQVSQ